MNAWAAASPCTPPPSVPRGAAARSPGGTVLRRYAALAAAVSRAVAAGERIAEPHALQRHARAVLDALGVGLDAEGPLRVPGTATGTLVVANHTSWLDVVALLAVEPVPLIAKREVAAWPVVGELARRTGTWFIDREAFRELPFVVRDLAARLRDGETVAVFPQATTWCTAPGGPFRRATFQAALDAGAPVRPVAVDFTREGTSSTAAAYVGGDTFASSLRRVAATDALTTRVRVCAPLWPYGHDRRSLAAAAHGAVTASCRGRTGFPAHEPGALCSQ